MAFKGKAVACQEYDVTSRDAAAKIAGSTGTNFDQWRTKFFAFASGEILMKEVFILYFWTKLKDIVHDGKLFCLQKKSGKKSEISSQCHFRDVMRVHAAELICSTGLSEFQTFKPMFCVYNKLRLHAEILS